VLAAGLPDSSRIKRGKEPRAELLLLAAAVDRLGLLFWAHTKDGSRGVNRPESIVQVLTGEKKIERATAYASAEAFERARARLLGENHG